MKPYLLLKGKKYPVRTIDFVEGVPIMAGIKRNGENEFYYNSEHVLNMYNQKNVLDFEKSLHWSGRYAPIYEIIQKLTRELLEVLKHGK